MTKEEMKQEDLFRFVLGGPEDFQIEFWRHFGKSAEGKEYKDFKDFVGTELDLALSYVKGAMAAARTIKISPMDQVELHAIRCAAESLECTANDFESKHGSCKGGWAETLRNEAQALYEILSKREP